LAKKSPLSTRNTATPWTGSLWSFRRTSA
jgi:hypothetical protein